MKKPQEVNTTPLLTRYITGVSDAVEQFGSFCRNKPDIMFLAQAVILGSAAQVLSSGMAIMAHKSVAAASQTEASAYTLMGIGLGMLTAEVLPKAAQSLAMATCNGIHDDILRREHREMQKKYGRNPSTVYIRSNF